MKWIVLGGAVMLVAIIVFGSMVYGAMTSKAEAEAIVPAVVIPESLPEPGPASADLNVTFENSLADFVVMANPSDAARFREAGAATTHSLVESVGRPITTCSIQDGCAAVVAMNDISEPYTMQAAMDEVAELAINDTVIPFTMKPVMVASAPAVVTNKAAETRSRSAQPVPQRASSDQTLADQLRPQRALAQQALARHARAEQALREQQASAEKEVTEPAAKLQLVTKPQSSQTQPQTRTRRGRGTVLVSSSSDAHPDLPRRETTGN